MKWGGDLKSDVKAHVVMRYAPNALASPGWAVGGCYERRVTTPEVLTSNPEGDACGSVHISLVQTLTT